MELRHLRYFIAVADNRNFTVAARELGISQPPLSQQIQDLEMELGATLLRRTSRHVELTAAGRDFLEQARAILAHVKRAKEQVRAIDSGNIGLVNIGATGSVLPGPLARLITDFNEQYPKAAVRIHEMGPEEQLAALLVHRIDVAFIRRPRHDAALIAEMAWREAVGVALPVSHPLATAPQIALRDLKDQNFVFLRLSDSRFARYLQDCCIDARFIPRISHEVVESYSLTSLVAAGLGVALVPERTGRLTHLGFVYRPLAGPAPVADVEMIYRPVRSNVAELFLTLARNSFARPAEPPRKETKPSKGAVERRLKAKSGRAEIKKKGPDKASFD